MIWDDRIVDRWKAGVCPENNVFIGMSSKAIRWNLYDITSGHVLSIPCEDDGSW